MVSMTYQQLCSVERRKVIIRSYVRLVRRDESLWEIAEI